MVKRKDIAAGLVVSCLVAVSACASTDYGARSAGERPTDLSSSEASFWYQMDEFETRLKRSGSVIEDESLNTSLRDSTCAIAPSFCEELRIYIVHEPSFNASMAPNGMMLVHTGLLLRAEDDSQLAAVLAHEFVHFEENHTLERYGAMKNTNRGMAMVGSLGVVGLVGMIAVADGASGFVQSQETQADLLGMQYMAEAGYNAGSAELIWSNLSEELAASSDKKKQKRATKGQFLSTHPGIAARMSALRTQAAAYDSVATNPEAYRARIRPFLKSWLDDEVAKGDPGSTLQLIARLQALEEDLGLLHYTRGRVLALRGDEGDQGAAIAAWQESATHANAPPETYRELGEMYRRQNRSEDAAAAYRIYLESAPDARDTAIIQRQIEKIEDTNS